MSKEIERKFLVSGQAYKEQARSCSHIMQGYILSDEGRTVRVRRRDDKAYLTIKGPSTADGTTRFEWEREITTDDAAEMFSMCRGGLIDKHRYLVSSGPHVWEVDEFHGDNDGLVMAEVELSSADEPYKQPDFISEEVTGDARYYNSMLMKQPYKEWPEHHNKRRT